PPRSSRWGRCDWKFDGGPHTGTGAPVRLRTGGGGRGRLGPGPVALSRVGGGGTRGQDGVSRRPAGGAAGRSAPSAGVGALGDLGRQAVPDAVAALHAIPRGGVRLDLALRLGGGLPRSCAAGSGAPRRHAARGSGRGVRIAHLRGYGALAGALLRAPGGAGVDRAEYLPDQSGAGLVVFPGGVAGIARDRAGRAAGGPLRHLHALRGGVPHGGAGGRAGARCHAVPLVLYDRTARRDSPGATRRGGGARVRVRYLPGRVSVE